MERIRDVKMLIVLSKLCVGAFVSVVIGDNIGRSRGRMEYGVVGDECGTEMLFTPTDAGFNNEGAAVLIGEAGLHGGIRCINDGFLLQKLENVIKGAFALNELFGDISNREAIRASAVGPFRVAVHIEQGAYVAIFIDAVVGMALPIRLKDANIETVFFYDELVIPYRAINIKVKAGDECISSIDKSGTHRGSILSGCKSSIELIIGRGEAVVH